MDDFAALNFLDMIGLALGESRPVQVLFSIAMAVATGPFEDFFSVTKRGEGLKVGRAVEVEADGETRKGEVSSSIIIMLNFDLNTGFLLSREILSAARTYEATHP